MVQANVFDAFELVINTVSYPILGIGGREDVQWGQRTIAISIILFQQQLLDSVRRRYYLVSSGHPGWFVLPNFSLVRISTISTGFRLALDFL